MLKSIDCKHVFDMMNSFVITFQKQYILPLIGLLMYLLFTFKIVFHVAMLIGYCIFCNHPIASLVFYRAELIFGTLKLYQNISFKTCIYHTFYTYIPKRDNTCILDIGKLLILHATISVCNARINSVFTFAVGKDAYVDDIVAACHN